MAERTVPTLTIDLWRRLERSGHRASHAGVSSIAPPGTPPPVVTTATSAPSTWRAPPAPRSCTTASCRKPKPWVDRRRAAHRGC